MKYKESHALVENFDYSVDFDYFDRLVSIKYYDYQLRSFTK